MIMYLRATSIRENFEKQVECRGNKPIFYAKKNEELKRVISIVGDEENDNE